MTASLFTKIFVFFLLTTLCVKIWLAKRQMNAIVSHKNKVPEQFAQSISLQAHQKAADYSVAKIRFSLFSLMVDTVVLLCFTVFGGLQKLALALSLTDNSLISQISLIILVCIITSIISLPFDYYLQFVIEEQFGFNKMTPALFVKDLIKNTIVSAIIGIPLIAIILFVMQKTGTYWWIYAWILLMVFQVLMMIIYPNFIAPLFNKFSPLEDETLKNKIEHLMQRVGFQSKGLFVMDGSKRSTHGNAYFTGFGSSKRVVFFDTLIDRLEHQEIEAVLAHELGHFKLKHILKRIIVMSILSLLFLALLGFLKSQGWFYTGLGVHEHFASDGMALILFALVLPLFTFFLSPIMAFYSRKHEFEADAFAAQHAQASDLIHALVKMYKDNASTLTPDDLHSAFYDSHPPASIRIKHLLKQ